MTNRVRTNTVKNTGWLFCLLIFCFPFSLRAEASPPVPGDEQRITVEQAGHEPPPFNQNQTDHLRSFAGLFPYLGEEQKKAVFSEGGYIHSLEKNEPLTLIPAPGSGIDINDRITRAGSAYLAESLLVVPYSQRILGTLDIYNALGKIRDLKGRLYHSHTRNAAVPLFEDATRLESAVKNTPVPDPQPARELPVSETVFMRLKDVNFGNSYYRGDISTSPYGITYSLTNYKTLTYLFFTVMKEERFAAILYMEPLAEGMLVYSAAGADASDFIASKIDIPSAISKRLAVFIGWVSDNLKTVQ